MTRHLKKTHMENIKKTQRKRMPNMEFSTRFFLSKSEMKVPRMQNIKKCWLDHGDILVFGVFLFLVVLLCL